MLGKKADIPQVPQDEVVKESDKVDLDTGTIIPDTANEMEICSNGSTGVSTVENIISTAQECDRKINVVTVFPVLLDEIKKESENNSKSEDCFEVVGASVSDKSSVIQKAQKGEGEHEEPIKVCDPRKNVTKKTSIYSYLQVEASQSVDQVKTATVNIPQQFVKLPCNSKNSNENGFAKAKLIVPELVIYRNDRKSSTECNFESQNVQDAQKRENANVSSRKILKSNGKPKTLSKPHYIWIKPPTTNEE